MKIGVLALQGAVAEHLHTLEKVGADPVAVKTADQVDNLDGLVIPGGESTTMGKLIRRKGLLDPIREMDRQKKPLFGTCAGLILMAQHIQGEEAHLGLIDITVKRNAFGRQVDSFEAPLSIQGVGENYPAVFIRAPLIEQVGPDVEILAEIQGQIVAARQEHRLVASFHPELTDDLRFHQYFCDMVRVQKSES